MDPRKFASIFGSACLAVGILSLVPSLTGSAVGLPDLHMPISYGLFAGLFPINLMNKMALLFVGGFGLSASSAKFNALPRSIAYARAVCVLMLAMAVLGLIPQTSTLFGYWPLFGTANVTASMVFALISGLFGYYMTAKVPTTGRSGTDYSSPLTSR